ncbi:MAG: protein-export chaperone SecB [Clostridia bacterium]|nr:protein-export chaperone SecB [Clostridia bacterium]
MKNNNVNMNSSLQFKGYTVNHLFFENKESTNNSYNVMPELMSEIKFEDDKKFSVVLGCKIEPTEENPFPFSLEVIITGNFEVECSDSNYDTLVNKNSVAILFPYLRSTISMLTLNANKTPLVLPTVNIVKMLEKLDEV